MLRNLLDTLKRTFPGFFGTIFRTRDYFLVHVPSRTNIHRLRKSDARGVQVFYMTTRFPKRPATRSEHAHGGSVKLTYLAEHFPHHFPSANLAYIVTTIGHPLQDEILQAAKRRGLKFVVNHDGVAFPAWAGDRYEEFNQVSRRILDRADFIVYQSRFSKLSSDLYLSPPGVPHEIVYNPVDTEHFSPQDVKKPRELTLLLGGNQYERYRLELALRTLHSLLKVVPAARLIVTGTLWLPYREAREWTAEILAELNLTERVEFVGKYTQAEARVYTRGHICSYTPSMPTRVRA